MKKVLLLTFLLLLVISGCKPLEKIKELIPPIEKVVCGDNICNGKETSETCCVDCGCPDRFFCEENVCKRKAELKSINYQEIALNVYLIDEGGNIHNCDSESNCLINNNYPTVDVMIDDPYFLPKRAVFEFVIPLENLGDESLSRVSIKSSLDGNIIFSETKSLNQKEFSTTVIKKEINIKLGDNSVKFNIKIDAENQSFNFDYEIISTLMMAILKQVSFNDFSYKLTPTLETARIDKTTREQILGTEQVACSKDIGCQADFKGNNFLIDFEPYKKVISNRIEMSIPIKNIGNKRFDNLIINPPFSFRGYSGGSISLEPEETALVDFRADLKAKVTQNLNLYVYSDKEGYGKKTSIDFNLNYNYQPYYNLGCYPSFTIDYKNPKIKTLANSIIKNPPTKEFAYDNLNDIYIWVIKNTDTWDWNIPGTGSRKYASVVYEDGWGDCDDRSNLIVALARAVNIPPEQIRVQCGYICNVWQSDKECYDSATSGHCWVDFDYNGQTYNLESRSLEQDFLTKIGLPLGIKAGHLFHKEIMIALQRALEDSYYNDKICGRKFSEQ